MSIVVELHSPDRSNYPTILLPPLGGVACPYRQLNDGTGQDRTGVCVCARVRVHGEGGAGYQGGRGRVEGQRSEVGAELGGLRGERGGDGGSVTRRETQLLSRTADNY